MKQKDKKRTTKVSNLGGLVHISQLDKIISDPATLLGLFVEAKEMLETMNSKQHRRLHEKGMKAFAEHETNKTSLRPYLDKSK